MARILLCSCLFLLAWFLPSEVLFPRAANRVSWRAYLGKWRVIAISVGFPAQFVSYKVHECGVTRQVPKLTYRRGVVSQDLVVGWLVAVCEVILGVASRGRHAFQPFTRCWFIHDDPTRSVFLATSFANFFGPTFAACDLGVLVGVTRAVVDFLVVLPIGVRQERACAIAWELRNVGGFLHVPRAVRFDRDFYVVRRSVYVARLGDQYNSLRLNVRATHVVGLRVFWWEVADRVLVVK